MEYKDVGLSQAELKTGATDGEISGYASTFTLTPDSFGDTIAPGAFARSLASGRKIRLLWQHDLQEPIGLPLELYENSRGLRGRWRLANTETGKKARELVKAGLVDALSIGFTTEDYALRADGGRLLKDIQLYEVSVVTIPANSEATIDGWKSRAAVGARSGGADWQARAAIEAVGNDAESRAMRLMLARRRLRLRAAGVLV